jgi:hypothetical protein
MARVHYRLGDFDKAIELARDKIKSDPGQVLAHAILVGAQWKKGQREEAAKAFEALRERSGQLDLDIPMFAELAPLARDLNLNADWRTAPTVSSDAGVRPDWPRSGPSAGILIRLRLSRFRLKITNSSPSASIEGSRCWSFSTSARGVPTASNSSMPRTSDQGFLRSWNRCPGGQHESPDGLKEDFRTGEGRQRISFPIVSDHAFDAFHAFRSFDDFENIPLHGTFLIDSNGLVRWQNISYQPFKDVNWLLEESKRLLGIPTQLPSPATVSRSTP